MKYIIDVPDEAIELMGGRDHFSMFVEPDCKAGDCKHYALRISKGDIEPYTETDRKAIEDEVWSLAREIAYGMSLQECIDAGMLHDDDIYDSASGVLEKLTYQEAKAKFDAWKTEREQICVGDEVLYHGNKYIVGHVGADEVYHIVDRNWIRVVVQGDY